MAILKEFEELLKVALTDGIITPAERQVLLKKAVSLGMDIDEADMYISAEIQKLEMQLEATKKQELGRVCPSCGTSIPQLASKCPACGEPVTAEASKELKSVLNNLESALVLLKSGKDVDKSRAEVERYIREAKLYHDNNAKINMLVDEVKQEMLKADKQQQKRNIINFFKRSWKWILIVVAVISVLILIMRACAPTAADDIELCLKAVNESIKDGDMAEAESYVAAFADNKGYSPAEKATVVLMEAYIDQDNLEKAISVGSAYGVISEYSFNQPAVVFKIRDLLIEKGQYDKAEKIVNLSNDTYYEFLCKCIDDMKSKGNNEKVKSFINRKLSFYQDYDKYPENSSYKVWGTKAVKKRLYEYAEIN